MSGAVMALQPGAGFFPFPDRGLSSDATQLRDLIVAALDSPHSMFGEPKRSAFRLLNEVYTVAICEGDEVGPIPLRPGTYEYAQAFLRAMPMQVPLPDISVDSDGEITFDWYYSPNDVFAVSIGSDGTLTYAGLFGGERSHGTEQLGEAIPEHIAINLARVKRIAAAAALRDRDGSALPHSA